MAFERWTLEPFNALCANSEEAATRQMYAALKAAA